MAYDPYAIARLAQAQAAQQMQASARNADMMRSGLSSVGRNVGAGISSLMGKKAQLDQLAGYNQPELQDRIARIDQFGQQVSDPGAYKNLAALAGMDAMDRANSMDGGAAIADQGPAIYEDVMPPQLQAERERLAMLAGGAPRLRDRRESGVTLDQLIGQQRRFAEDVAAQRAADAEVAKIQAKEAAKPRDGGDPFKAIKLEADLQDRVDDATQHSRDVVQAFTGFDSLFRNRDGDLDFTKSTPQDQIAAIFSFMKSLDPKSIVRDSEFRVASGAGSLITKVKNIIDSAGTGNQLQDYQLKDMYNTMYKLAEMFDTDARVRARKIVPDSLLQDYAARAGINPENVRLYDGLLADYEYIDDIVRPDVGVGGPVVDPSVGVKQDLSPLKPGEAF